MATSLSVSPSRTITSTVSITLDSGDGETYVGNIKEGGQLCEMWGYTNGYGNNFDSQYIPFEITIGKDDYEGYITGVFDHRLLLPPQGGNPRLPVFPSGKSRRYMYSPTPSCYYLSGLTCTDLV